MMTSGEAPTRSINDIKDVGWPEGATGLRWPGGGTEWTECRTCVEVNLPQYNEEDRGTQCEVLFDQPGVCDGCSDNAAWVAANTDEAPEPGCAMAAG